jgi:hypothetical protein
MLDEPFELQGPATSLPGIGVGNRRDAYIGLER